MYTFSVKGTNKVALEESRGGLARGNSPFTYKGFFYVKQVEDRFLFVTDVDDAIKFNSLKDAVEFAREHYTELLEALLNSKVRIASGTFAIRKLIFKTIRNIDKSIFNDLSKEVKKNEETSDASDEISDNVSEPDSEMEVEMSVDAEETSSSDIQFVSE